jgi:hypothetical protein
MFCTLFAVGMTHENSAVWFLCRSKSRSVDHGFSPPFDLDSLRSKVEGRFESVGRGKLSEITIVLFIFLAEIVCTRGADKSLARPGRKQATATKLGFYATYSPRSPIHFLSRCSNF